MSPSLADDKPIRTAPRPDCALCGSAGESIYLAQSDRLFGTSGSWNLKRCTNRGCRLIWLDPMPLEEDLGKAYGNYYTHAQPTDSVPQEPGRVGVARRIYRLLRQGYLAERYGYEVRGRRPAARSLGKLLYLFPLRRSGVDLEVRFLHAVPRGKLLDVGCGSGVWLMAMRELGWGIEGVDFDSRAVQAATERGLAVRCGSLEQQSFPDGTFDAVTMSHVIEHLPDPIRSLKECARILKPGGKLVLWTPNTSSLGHRVLKQHWRGLEPPRHLYLFSPPSMRSVMERGGFNRISIRTRNSRYIWQQGVLLWTRRLGMHPILGVKLATALAPSMLAWLEAVLLVAFEDTGEWLDVQASRG